MMGVIEVLYRFAAARTSAHNTPHHHNKKSRGRSAAVNNIMLLLPQVLQLTPARRRMVRPFLLWSLVLGMASFVSVRTHLALNDELARESRSTLYRQPTLRQPQQPQQQRQDLLPSMRRRRIRETSANTGDSEPNQFKLLAFGFSWDASNDVDFTEAYPNLVAPRARLVSLNQAKHLPVGALACTQSIVGDDGYDAITIEFYEWTRTHQSLAERLRSRFPDATLVLVRMWNPSQIVYTRVDGSTVDLNSWRGNLTLHSNEVGLRVLESGGPDRWALRLPNDSEILDKARFDLKASLFTLPGPALSDFNFPLNLNAYLTLFEANDPDRLTSRGNSVLHLGLQTFLQSIVHPRNPNSRTPELGSWGPGDDCHVWYSTGQYPQKTSARRVELVSAAAAANNSSHHKHALELQAHDFLTVHNPFSEPRMLFLSYLTSCDEHDRRVYPRIRVQLNAKATVVVDPYHEDCSHSLHLARTSPVGYLDPGDSTLQFYPLDASSSHSFRLVGASLLFEPAASDVDLSLEPDPTLPSDSWGLW